jgi:hypothetical protein
MVAISQPDGAAAAGWEIGLAEQRHREIGRTHDGEERQQRADAPQPVGDVAAHRAKGGAAEHDHRDDQSGGDA